MNLRGHIVKLFTRHRLTLSDEKLLQKQIATIMSADGLYFRREYQLTPHDVVDFFVLHDEIPPLTGCAVEVKIKGSKRSVYRQCERYCAHDSVRELVLATNLPMALPETICGKPTSVALLGLGWL